VTKSIDDQELPHELRHLFSYNRGVAQLEPTPEVPAYADGSLFMRPFAIGMTAYLLGYNFIHMLTRGAFKSPDLVSDVYFFVLATYAGAPEVKRWASKVAEDPEGWNESIRKGGPLIAAWFVLWGGAVLWRIYDPSVPMPAELKTILLQVMGLFFGTYALRQVRKRAVRSGEAREAEPGADDLVLDCIRQKGSATPKTLREALGLSRSTVTRVLAAHVEAGRLAREGDSPQDPSALYRLK
jgi:uncharacterized membrane protein